MGTKKRLLVCALAVLLVGWGFPFAVGAQERGSVGAGERGSQEAAPELVVAGNLGASPTATDVYHVLCAMGTSRILADVNDNGGVDGIRLGVCVHDSGGTPAHCTIAPDGGLSPLVAAGGGAGAYYVTIFKSPSGTVEAYDSFIQCFNAGGGTTNTVVTLTPVQNE
jgi:hypothetical protein